MSLAMDHKHVSVALFDDFIASSTIFVLARGVSLLLLSPASLFAAMNEPAVMVHSYQSTRIIAGTTYYVSVQLSF